VRPGRRLPSVIDAGRLYGPCTGVPAAQVPGGARRSGRTCGVASRRDAGVFSLGVCDASARGSRGPRHRPDARPRRRVLAARYLRRSHGRRLDRAGLRRLARTSCTGPCRRRTAMAVPATGQVTSSCTAR
jgi:hypothetical protein